MLVGLSVPQTVESLEDDSDWTPAEGLLNARPIFRRQPVVLDPTGKGGSPCYQIGRRPRKEVDIQQPARRNLLSEIVQASDEGQ